MTFKDTWEDTIAPLYDSCDVGTKTDEGKTFRKHSRRKTWDEAFGSQRTGEKSTGQKLKTG